MFFCFKQRGSIRTRFWRANFRLCYVKMLVNPLGFTVLLPCICENSLLQNSATWNMQNFWWLSRAMMAARLSPADIINPKNAEIMLFQACSDTPPLLKMLLKQGIHTFFSISIWCDTNFRFEQLNEICSWWEARFPRDCVNRLVGCNKLFLRHFYTIWNQVLMEW